MSGLTVEQKTTYAAQHAREPSAEKHFYDLNLKTYRAGYFSCTERNEGHWDIYAPQVQGKASAWRFANPKGRTTAEDGLTERAFCIRGEGTEVFVRDERWNPHRPHPRGSMEFRSVQGAMLWISEELMTGGF